eukprot:CAMPEP_0171227972 /NCGR_PEP_ID=MMETSP0790-20130122/38122_1 /TAXON_ID=2925 /ORGANISM="Alexandrium catenella, Strain OF101" /LENGTH=301 /DNA_ID=CAMNT_0011694101 /DNA_START=14 /DNA_END=915 /DNA_ORIENTATION=-
MVVPMAVAGQVEERREWAEQVQQESGAGLEVKEGRAADAWPEERLVHLKGSFDARHSALEQLLRGLDQDTLEDECLVKLLVPSAKVSPCRGNLDRLFQSYGMDAAITKEKVLGSELGIVVASGEVDAVAVGLWELMKIVEKVHSTSLGKGADPSHGHAAPGAEHPGEADGGAAGVKAESEGAEESDALGGANAHIEEWDDGGVDFGGADDPYEEGAWREDFRELPEPLSGGHPHRLPPLEVPSWLRHEEAEDDSWGNGWGRRTPRTAPTDAPPAPEGILLAQALPSSMPEGGEAEPAEDSR